MTLGERIKNRRCEVGLKVEQLASACGVKASAVYQWQSDETEPTGPNIVKLAIALKTYEVWLVDGTEPKVRAIHADTLSPEESEMIESYRFLGRGQQGAMHATINNLADGVRKERKKL